MRDILPGTELPQCGMRFVNELGPGGLGYRWSVQMIHAQRGEPAWSGIAEVIDVRDGRIKTQCDNITRLVGAVRSRGVAAPIATEWINADQFTAISDLRPGARSLTSFVAHPDFTPPDEEEFWSIAAMLYRAVAQLHRMGLVHGAISPDAFSLDGDALVLSEFWWVWPFDGRPWELPEGHAREGLPDAVLRFSAPEFRLGRPTTKAGDLYSLGAVLQFLVSGGSHAEPVSAGGQPASIRYSPPDPESERVRFALALAQDDPAQRIQRPQIEAWLNEKLLRRVNHRYPKAWKIALTTEFGASLHGLWPDRLLEIIDLYFYADSLQLGCRLEELEEWFTVQGLLLTGGRTYLALSGSPDQYERLDYVPMTVVCLESDWQIRSIGEYEMLAVRDDLFENVYRGTSSDLTYAQFVLGPIRKWERPPEMWPSTLEPH